MCLNPWRRGWSSSATPFGPTTVFSSRKGNCLSCQAKWLTPSETRDSGNSPKSCSGQVSLQKQKNTVSKLILLYTIGNSSKKANTVKYYRTHMYISTALGNARTSLNIKDCIDKIVKCIGFGTSNLLQSKKWQLQKKLPWTTLAQRRRKA